MTDLDARLRALTAAAVLQRVRWGDHDVDVPLALPHRVDPDEVMLKMADGGWLILAQISSATSLRASLRRWVREAEEGRILALILASPEVEEEIVDEPPDRPAVRLRAALLQRGEALWDLPWPALADVLGEAARRREAPPQAVLQSLRDREGQTWPARTTPPPNPTFERLVFALAQAHDLVRLLRGEARLRLRSGNHVTVLAATGDPSIDHPALAAALARIAAGMADDDVEPGILVVDGPEDLLERVQKVLGRSARLGRVNTISPSGVVRPADAELSQLLSLAHRWEGQTDLFGLLEEGLSRARGRTIDRGAAAAGESRLGLVRGLIRGMPGLRLGWVGRRGAELLQRDSALRIRWVGPEGGRVEDVMARWRLAAIAARWTGHTVDLLLEGGDSATWDRVRRELGGAPEGHVFHLDSQGGVHTRAGLLGWLRPVARVLRRLARRPDSERLCSVEDLQRELDRGAEADFRSAVLDAAFVDRLTGVTPWATRGILGAIVVVYAMQLRWDIDGALFQSGGALVVRMGALTGEGLLPILTSEPWRLLSSSFLHAAWWHIGLNAWALWVLGRRLEAMLGPERLIILYVVSCLGGAMLHEAFSSPGDVAVGASTGILGLLAAQGALTLFRGDLLPERIRRLLWREAWVNGLIILGLSLLPFVGGLAHLGGAIAGFALVATGLLTRGITPSSALDTGPTRVAVPTWLRPVTAGLGAVAVGAAVAASVAGEPWHLNSPEGRVDEVAFFDGALTVPVPRRSAVPAQAIRLDDGSVRLLAGDVLRDGLRIEAIAWSVPEAQGARQLEDAVAMYGQDSLDWITTQVGDHPAAQLATRVASDRYVRQRWLLAHDGAVVDLTVTALPDTAAARLGGSWTRLPAGVRMAPPFDGSAPSTGLQDLTRARSGEVVPQDPILTAVALAEQDPDEARRLLAVALGGSREARSKAARVAQVVRGEAAVLLSGRALAEAYADERPLLRGVHVEALFRAGRFDDAANEAGDDTLTRASALWYAGRDGPARQAAMTWQQDAVPWWATTLTSATGGELPPSLSGNLAWADLMQGDAARCRVRSEQAWRADEDLIFARFNEAICALVDRDQDVARAVFDDALELARTRGEYGLLANVAVDLQALVDRDVPGAQELLERVQPASVPGAP